MSHRDTPHFLKTLGTLWSHTEGPGVFAGDPKGPEPGGIWTLLTSIQQPPMKQIHVYSFASKITTPFGTICPLVRNSLSLSALTLHLIYTCDFKAQLLCPILESSGDFELPEGRKNV